MLDGKIIHTPLRNTHASNTTVYILLPSVSVEGRVLVLMLVTIVTVATSLETVQILTSRGESGSRCGRNRRECVSGMRCEGNRCKCPNGSRGNGEFDCVKPNEQMCFLASDMRVHLQGFGGASAAVNIPCSYRASRFLIRKEDSFQYCTVEIHVTNERWRDSYRARAVRVTVGLNDPVHQIQRYMETTVTGRSSKANHRTTYHVRSGPMNVLAWGSSNSQQEKSANVDLIRHTVDEVNNILKLDVPGCDTRLRFRAHDSSLNRQRQLPGVSIVVPDTAQFIQRIGDYPSSLCGRPQDTHSLYKRAARSQGLGDASTSILAAFLEQRSPQFENPVAEECQTAMNLYAASSDRKSDIKACAFLLNRKHTQRCLVNRRLSPLRVFNACLKLRQTPDDVTSCSIVRTVRSRCSNAWVGPRASCS